MRGGCGRFDCRLWRLRRYGLDKLRRLGWTSSTSGGSGGGWTKPTITGIATPSSVSVVTATSGN